MLLHHLQNCILFSSVVSAGYFSNIFDTAKDTLQGRNILKSLQENVIESIGNNELSAGLFVCNLFAGKPAAAAQVLGQTVSNEVADDYNSLVSLVKTIPHLVESDWQAIVSGGKNAVSIAEEVITAPTKIKTIASAAWAAFTSGVACEFKTCGTSAPPWAVMSSSCSVIFAQSTTPVVVTVTPTSTKTVAVTTTPSATQRSAITTTLPSSTMAVVVTQRPTTTLPSAAPAATGSMCARQSLVSLPTNIGSGTTKTCCLYYVPSTGDSCYSIGKKYGITLDQFRSWNTQIDAGCSDLLAAVAYCVSGFVDTPAAVSVASSASSPISLKSTTVASVAGSTSKTSTSSSTTTSASTIIVPRPSTPTTPTSTPTSTVTPYSSSSDTTRTTVVAQSASTLIASASTTTSSMAPFPANAAMTIADTGRSVFALAAALGVTIAMYAL